MAIISIDEGETATGAAFLTPPFYEGGGWESSSQVFLLYNTILLEH